MKAEKADLLGSTAYALALLFAIIFFAVLGLSPAPDNSLQREILLESHESLLYFINAEVMAKRLFPDPSARWTHYLIDSKAGCVPLGHGVWYAYGRVEYPSNLLPLQSPWEVCFLPEGQVPLYVRVGDQRTGDFKAAIKMSGYIPRPPENTDEKKSY